MIWALYAAAVLAILLAGFEMSVRITKKRNLQFDFEELKLVDVTGRNDDGTKRQEILQGIESKKGEYRKLDYELRQYRKQGEDAFGVYVNGHQIGNVSREDVPALIDSWDRIEKGLHVRVYPVKGGKNYGAALRLRLKK